MSNKWGEKLERCRGAWRPALASILAIGASASTLAGLARVFFVDSPGPWPAAQGGALFGVGFVAIAWAMYLIRCWTESRDAMHKTIRGGSR